MPDSKPKLNLATPLFPILIFLITFTAFIPGQMSPDSLGQFGEALRGSYSVTHQPIMAASWRLLLRIWRDPAVLFTVHLLLYSALFYGFARLYSEKWWKQLLVLTAACLPPLWSQMIVVWKDTELSLTLMGTYLFAILLLKAFREQKGKINVRIAVLASLFLFFFYYSAAVRENSFPALVPVMFFMVSNLIPGRGVLRTISLGLLLGATGFLTTSFLNYGILQARHGTLYQANEIFDIVGTFTRNRQADLIPEYWQTLNPKATPEALEQNYDPTSVVQLIFWNEGIVKLTANQAQLNELNHKWVLAWSRYPLDFLSHRWQVFKCLMGIGMKNTYYPLRFGIDPNGFGIRFQGDPELSYQLERYFYFFRNSFFFRGWFYLAVLFSIAGYCFFKRPASGLLREPAFCSALSGLFYGLSYFICAPAADFRFLYPVVTLSLISLYFLASLLDPENRKQARRPIPS